MDYATPSLFFGMAAGAALMWAACKWYYTKDGKAKLAAREAELRAAAKDAGINLPK